MIELRSPYPPPASTTPWHLRLPQLTWRVEQSCRECLGGAWKSCWLTTTPPNKGKTPCCMTFSPRMNTLMHLQLLLSTAPCLNIGRQSPTDWSKPSPGGSLWQLGLRLAKKVKWVQESPHCWVIASLSLNVLGGIIHDQLQVIQGNEKYGNSIDRWFFYCNGFYSQIW